MTRHYKYEKPLSTIPGSTYEDMEIKFIDDFTDVLRLVATSRDDPIEREYQVARLIRTNYRNVAEVYLGRRQSTLRDTDPLKLVYLSLALGAPTTPKNIGESWTALQEVRFMQPEDKHKLNRLSQAAPTEREASLAQIDDELAKLVPPAETQALSTAQEAFRLSLTAFRAGMMVAASEAQIDFIEAKEELLAAMEQTTLQPTNAYGFAPWLANVSTYGITRQ